MSGRDEEKPFGLRETTNLVYLLALFHKLALTVFLRRNMGLEAIGLPGLVTFVFLMAFATQDHGMRLYFFIWLLMLVCQRILTMANEWRGYHVHSRYGGQPSMVMGLFRIKDETRALMVEPFFCFAMGLCLLSLSEMLGTFVGFGVISLSITTGIEQEVTRRRVMMQRDAEIEARHVQDVYFKRKR